VDQEKKNKSSQSPPQLRLSEAPVAQAGAFHFLHDIKCSPRNRRVSESACPLSPKRAACGCLAKNPGSGPVVDPASPHTPRSPIIESSPALG
jgi:hypothetical protein